MLFDTDSDNYEYSYNLESIMRAFTGASQRVVGGAPASCQRAASDVAPKKPRRATFRCHAQSRLDASTPRPRAFQPPPPPPLARSRSRRPLFSREKVEALPFSDGCRRSSRGIL